MSDNHQGISEIYQIRDLMNAMEESGNGFFRWDTSISYIIEDSNGGHTEYTIIWNHNVDKYEVVVTKEEGDDA